MILFARGRAKAKHGGMLALLKYPFYYTIRRGFGNFFGTIHVLTRHLAPELDHFLFCPGFWSMLCFGRKLDIFGDVLTHGHNWAKMRNKEKRRHAKDGTERAQAGRPCPFPGPIGLSFLQREVFVNPSLCFTKTTNQNRLYIPRSRRQRGGNAERIGREHPETSF